MTKQFTQFYDIISQVEKVLTFRDALNWLKVCARARGKNPQFIDLHINKCLFLVTLSLPSI